MIVAAWETDFNVFADRKEITVVYGILDQTDSVHLIKITKALSASEKILQYSAIEDSSGYSGNLEVKLSENRNGSSHSIIFDTTSIFTKEPGMFYYPHQLLYKSDVALNQDAVYTLLIRNKISGAEVSATTELIHDFEVEIPDQGSASFEFQKRMTSGRMFKWKSAVNGTRYQIIVRFFFKEISATGDTLLRSVEWYQDIVKSENASGGMEMVSRYKNDRFFSYCTNYIPYPDEAREADVNARLVHRVDFIFTVVGKDFDSYLDFNTPQAGVFQGKPEYSNITNGIGLFSCRYSKTISLKLGQFTELDLMSMANLKFIKNPDNY